MIYLDVISKIADLILNSIIGINFAIYEDTTIALLCNK